MRPASRLREVLARNQRNPAARAVEAVLHTLEKLTVTSRRSHAVFERMYRYGGFLIFSPAAVIVLAVLVVLASRSAVELWVDSGEVTKGFAGHAVVAILLVKVCFWLTVVSHQLVHALACVHYKRRVREFGFTMLHGFIPTFYADVTDIFMASRRARIVNALSGPLVHLFLGALYLWAASFPRPGLLKAFLAASALLQLYSFLISLYPFCFLEMDGYHILVDLIGFPTLNHDSVRFVRESLGPRLLRRERLEPRRGGLPRVFRALVRLRGGVRSMERATRRALRPVLTDSVARRIRSGLAARDEGEEPAHRFWQRALHRLRLERSLLLGRAQRGETRLGAAARLRSHESGDLEHEGDCALSSLRSRPSPRRPIFSRPRAAGG